MNMHPQGGVANRDQRPNAGVDVCKQHLDVCLGTLELRVANDASGWNELTAKCEDAGVDLVVLEATGGYERGLVCALQEAGITVARVNPRQARDFAKSMGVLAKTDQVDARTLRDFADVLARHPERAKYITAMPDEHRQQLAELMMVSLRRTPRRRSSTCFHVPPWMHSHNARGHEGSIAAYVLGPFDASFGVTDHSTSTKRRAVRAVNHNRLAGQAVGGPVERSVSRHSCAASRKRRTRVPAALGRLWPLVALNNDQVSGGNGLAKLENFLLRRMPTVDCGLVAGELDDRITGSASSLRVLKLASADNEPCAVPGQRLGVRCCVRVVSLGICDVDADNPIALQHVVLLTDE
jgi:hypothetical protein